MRSVEGSVNLFKDSSLNDFYLVYVVLSKVRASCLDMFLPFSQQFYKYLGEIDSVRSAKQVLMVSTISCFILRDKIFNIKNNFTSAKLNQTIRLIRKSVNGLEEMNPNRLNQLLKVSSQVNEFVNLPDFLLSLLNSH